MATLSRLLVELGLDDSQFSKGLAGAKGALGGFGSAVEGAAGHLGSVFGHMTEIAGGFLEAHVIEKGVEALKDGISESIGEAEKLQQTQLRTNSIFGEGAEGVTGWAEGAANSLGLSNNAAQTAADSFGLLFKNVGFTSDSLPGMAEGMAGVVANVAAFNNADPAAVMDAMQSALAGNMRGLKQYGIVISQADVAQEALRITGKKNVADLTTQELVQARYNLVLGKTAFANKAVEDRSKTLAGASKILHANLANLREELGLRLIPVLTYLTIGLTAVVTVISYLLDNAVYPLVSWLADRLTPAFTGLWNALQPVFDAFGTLADVIGKAWDGGQSFTQMLQGVPAPLQTLALGLIQITHGVEKLVRAFDKDGLRGVLEQLPDTFRLVWDGLKNLGSVIGGLAVDLFNWTINVGVPTVVGWLTTFAGDAWTALKAAAGIAVDVLGDIGSWTLHVGLPTITGWLVIFGSDAWTALKAAARFVSGLVADLGDWTLNVAVPAVAYAGGASFDAIKNAIHDKITPMTVELGGWTLNVGLPKIAFTGGFGLGWLARGIFDLVKSVVVDLKGWLLLIFAPALELSPGVLLEPYIAGFLAVKMGPVGLAKWTLNLTAQPLIGFIEGARLGGTIQQAIEAANIVANLAKWTLSLGTPVFSGVDSIAQDIKNGVQISITNSGDWTGMLHDKGVDLIKGIENGWNERASAFSSWVRGFPGWVHDTMGDATSFLHERGVQLITGVMNGWTAESNIFATWASNFGNWVFGQVGDLSARLWQRGTQLINGVESGWTVESGVLAGYATGLGSWVSNKIGDLGRTLYGKGTALIGGVMNGWTDQAGNLSNWAHNLGDTISGWVGNLGSVLYSAGEDVIGGLWSGMEAEWQNVLDWLGGLASQIPAHKGPPAKDATLLVGNGLLIMQGLGRGLDMGWTRVTDQLSGYTSAIGGGYTGGLSPVGATASSGVGFTINGDVHLNVNSTGNAQADGQAIWAEFTRQAGLRFGV